MDVVTILVVDDERNAREGLKEALDHPGYRVLSASNGYQAEELLGTEQIDLVITDLRMPGMTGLELMKRASRIRPSAIFIIVTAYGSVDTAVEAMKEGAFDYLTKPINLEQLDLLVTRALKNQRLEAENLRLKEQLEKRYGFDTLLGRSAAMERVFEIIRQVRNSRSTILITGESGTGKELVARAVHQQGVRRDGPFIPVHCAALSPSLLESELFGHEKGAFTGAHSQHKGRFELADGGTLFLDEIGDIAPEIQVKLLRFLETREFERVGGTRPIRVDVRLLAATNSDLEKLKDEGKFREDLYYRLNVVRINLPPLRERREDIPLLARSFLEEFAMENGKKDMSFSPEALNLLTSYDWPGNVRELRNCIESMVVLTAQDQLTVDNLPPSIRAGAPGENSISPVSLNMKTAQRELLIRALQQAGGNKAEAARLLGISRRTLYRRLDEFGLQSGLG